MKRTRSFHSFKPLLPSRIVTKRINFDIDYSYVFDFFQIFWHEELSRVSIKQGGYVVATYDKCWYIDFVAEIHINEGDVKVNFLHLNESASLFYFSKYDDVY